MLTAQHSTAQHSTAQHSTAQHSLVAKLRREGREGLEVGARVFGEGKEPGLAQRQSL